MLGGKAESSSGDGFIEKDVMNEDLTSRSNESRRSQKEMVDNTNQESRVEV
jgi:hypothetical protein